MSPEREPFHEDDDEEEYAPQSIFAAGWFRAVLVLTVLAIVVVVSLPYLLNWFEPAPPAVVSQPAPKPAATAPSPAAPAPPAPASPAPAATVRPAEPTVAQKPAATPPVAEKTPGPSNATGGSPAGKTPDQKPVKAEAKPAPEKIAKAPAAKPSPALPRAAADARPAPPAAGPPGAETKPARATAPSAGKGEYWVQIGLFKEEPNAQALAKAVRDDGFPVEVTRITRSTGSVPAGSYHVVRAGSYPDLARAGKARDALRAKGHQGFVAKGSTP